MHKNLKNLEFGTKADTLERLHKLPIGAKTLPIISFTKHEWNSDSKNLLRNIAKLTNNEVIVRSSAINEDTSSKSNAGKYLSIGHVNINKKKHSLLCKAINDVFSSYDNDDDNQVFVQEHLSNIKIAGVAFTVDLTTYSDYYIINYDDLGGYDSVTSGATSDLNTYVHYKYSPYKSKIQNFNKLIKALNNLEQIFNNNHLDVEFAITEDNVIYILQVRPIVISTNNYFPLDKTKFQSYLDKLRKKVEKLKRPHPNLYGDTSIFGVMPDWNPAEIVGIKPRALALSLYKEIITDSIWAYQRNNYGYKNLRSFPLLISFLGQPFIDVRISFNSFIPNGLSYSLSHKLANYYLQELTRKKENHDKIEFNILFSCFFLDIDKQMNRLNGKFKTSETIELKQELLRITNDVINPEEGLCIKDLKKINQLEQRSNKIHNSEMAITDKIYWLLEECKRYGTLPFAGLARCGFIAMQFLHSLIRINIITEEEFHIIMSSLNTITSQFSIDIQKLQNGKLDKKEFISKYGHLRPGTYDILSDRYDDGFDRYFKPQENAESKINPRGKIHGKSFELSRTKKSELIKILKTNKLNTTPIKLFTFIKRAIEGREYAKFIFTKCLSDAIKLIEKLGEKYDINKQDMSNLDINVIMRLYSSLDIKDLPDILSENIKNNKEAYEITNCIKLPHLIIDESDIYQFSLDKLAPNFVTLKRIEGEVLLERDFNIQSMDGKIVFIKSADPGYDWIFSKSIKGLVTMYGGANSHMAIRTAELGICAIIGVGELNFNNWSKAKTLLIDCNNKFVKPIL